MDGASMGASSLWIGLSCNLLYQDSHKKWSRGGEEAPFGSTILNVFAIWLDTCENHEPPN